MCGFRSNQLGRHITGSHKITTHDYKEQFQGARTSRLTDKQIAKMKSTKLSKDSLHKRQLQEKILRCRELQEAQESPIVCALCGFVSMSSIISHITHKHKLTLIEYREKFPNSVVQRMCASQKEKMKNVWSSEKRIQKLLSKRSFPSEMKHWTRKGYSSDEAKKLTSEHQKSLALRQNNPLTKSLQSERNTGDNNPMSLHSISIRHSVSLDGAAHLTPCYGRKGEKHPMYGKKHSDEALKKIISNSFLHFSKRSKTEKQIFESLVHYGKSVDHNVALIGRYNCDIVFKEIPLIIELFGDYWHCNPSKWHAHQFNSRIKMTAQERWQKDDHKIKTLEAAGYKVIVIWESDWNNRQEQILKEIVDAADSIS